MATAPLDLIEEEEAPVPASPLAFIAQLALTDGDVSEILDDTELAKIGADVVRDYDNDLSDRKEWEDVARRALDRAAQEEIKRPHDAPPYRRSYVNYPILTTAAQQFNARAYPAICKSGSMVKVKVIGSDRGRPQVGQDGQPMMQPTGQPDPNTGQVPMLPVWAIPPGAKQKRADRVADYLNVYLEFRMEGWEADTDRLLYEMPIVGCGFRKLRWADRLQQASYVSALDLVVPNGARSLADSPRATEKLNDVWPFQIRQRMASGEYRRTDLDGLTDDEEKPRLLLEQHRLLDLDGDGIDEPYVITVDHETSRVLRLVADFDQDDVVLGEDDGLAMIRRRVHYVKYPFLPHPKGTFYDIGFGHLLEPLNDVANTAINQMFDAGHAQIAGGGFIAAGIRLQGSNRSESMRWQPGEYKVVNASGGDIRSGIIERTFPQPSVIMFNLLELILGAAKDITSVKDIVTGNAPNTAPVGTTLALIEQGLQVFTAIYKRVYRALGDEFALIRDNLVMFGGEEVAKDYLSVLDDPEADFASDFADADTDIKPVADPSSVTKMQQMAKAQFLLGMRGVGLNDMEINRRVLEAAGIDDIDQLIPQQQAPDPLMIAKLAESQSQTELNQARGQQAQATALKTVTEVGHTLGESDGYAGRVPDVAGPSGNPLDGAGVPAAGAGGEGNMGGGVVGPGGF